MRETTSLRSVSEGLFRLPDVVRSPYFIRITVGGVRPAMDWEWNTFTMSVGEDQLTAIAVLGIALALGGGLFVLVAALVKRIWAWMVGSRPHAPKEGRAPGTEPVSGSVLGVTASDLFVVRSNLNAVSRQVEDLERKLRAIEAQGANVVRLTRMNAS